MKNLFLIIACFFTVQINGQNQQADFNLDNYFFYLGIGANQSNLSNKIAGEFYYVVGVPNGGRVSLDFGGFDFPSEFANDSTGKGNGDSVFNMSISLGKTLFNKKYCMFSAEVGPAFTMFSIAKFRDDLLQNQEDIAYDSKITLGLKLKSRLEFKINRHYGIVFNVASNLNLRRSFYYYGVGMMYGGDFRRNKSKTKKKNKNQTRI